MDPYAADTDMLTIGEEELRSSPRGSPSRIYTRSTKKGRTSSLIPSGRPSIRDELRGIMRAVRDKAKKYGIRRVVESTNEEQTQALWKADDVAWFWLATGESNARPLGKEDVIRMHTATIRRMLDNESFSSAKQQMDLTGLPRDPKKNVLYEQWARERSPTDIVWEYVKSHLPGADVQPIKPGGAYYNRDNNNNNNNNNNNKNNNYDTEPFHMVLNSMTMYAYMVAMNPSAYGTHVRTLLSGAYQYALTHALIVQSLGIDADTYVDTHITQTHRPYVRDVLSREKVMSAVLDFNSAEKDTPEYRSSKIALIRALESTRLAREVKSSLDRNTMDTEDETPFKNLFGMYKALVILLAMVKLVQVDTHRSGDSNELEVCPLPTPPGTTMPIAAAASDIVKELGRWDTRTMHDREMLHTYAPKLGTKIRKALRKMIAANLKMRKYDRLATQAGAARATAIEKRNAAKMGCMFAFASTKYLLRVTYMFLLVIECDKANASTKKSELAKSAMFAVGADAAMRAYKATSAEVKRKYVMCVRDIERKSGNDHAKHFAMSALAHTTALFSTYAELLTSSHPSKRHADFDLMTSFGGEEEPGTQSVGMSDSHTETDENNKKTNSIEEVYTHGLASIKEMKGKQENASVKTYFECIETIIKDSHDQYNEHYGKGLVPLETFREKFEEKTEGEEAEEEGEEGEEYFGNITHEERQRTRFGQARSNSSCSVFDAVGLAMFHMRVLCEMDPPRMRLNFGESLDQTHSRTETTIKMLRVFFLTGIYRTLDVLDDRVKLVIFPLDANTDAKETEKRNVKADNMTGYEMQADELRDTLLRFIQMLRKEVLLTTAVEEYEGANRISTDDVASMLIRRTKALIRTVQMHLHSLPEGIVFVAAQHSSRTPGSRSEDKNPWPTGAALSLKPILEEVDEEDWYGRSTEIVSELEEKDWKLRDDYDIKGTYVPDELNSGRVLYDNGVMGEIEKVSHRAYNVDPLKHRKRTVPRK